MEQFRTTVYQLMRDGKPLSLLITSELNNDFKYDNHHKRISDPLAGTFGYKIYISNKRSKGSSSVIIDLDGLNIDNTYNLNDVYFFIKKRNNYLWNINQSPIATYDKFDDIPLAIFMIYSPNMHVKVKKLNSYKCDKYIRNFLYKFQNENCGFLISFNDFLKYLEKENIKINIDTFFELFKNKNVTALLPFYNILNEFDAKL